MTHIKLKAQIAQEVVQKTMSFYCEAQEAKDTSAQEADNVLKKDLANIKKEN